MMFYKLYTVIVANVYHTLINYIVLANIILVSLYFCLLWYVPQYLKRFSWSIQWNRIMWLSRERLTAFREKTFWRSKNQTKQFYIKLIVLQVHPKIVIILACSQTIYFLFKVRRARVIKNKQGGIYWPPAQGGWGGGRRKYFSFSRSAFTRRCFLKQRKEK